MLVGGAIVIAILVYIYHKREINLPFAASFEKDSEIQVFAAILFCFGGALLTSVFGISAALGAFVGGMVMHASKATDWIHDTLHAFRILFVAIFFISVGLQLDPTFIIANLRVIVLVLVVVYITNHFVNMVVLRLFACTWREAFMGGALLAQIGELSFLVSFSAYQLDILHEFGYQLTISIISLTLIISPFWISLSEVITTRFFKTDKTRVYLPEC
jgi:CPA2 family monovalent cation:H+ antiporter-2